MLASRSSRRPFLHISLYTFPISNGLRGIENGEGIRALIRVRCDNMEENNKYRLGREARKCMFCERRRDE